MDRATISIYEREAEEYARRRAARRTPERPAALAAAVPEGAVRADLGCGPGLYTPHLGAPVVVLDAAFAMVAEARRAAPHALAVQADLEALPLRRGALGGAWAVATYMHVPSARLPLALADLHRSLTPEAPAVLELLAGEGEGQIEHDDFPGRFFARMDERRMVDIVEGAGFSVDALEAGEREWRWLRCTRRRTLPDFVGPGMRVLVCGLNPSLHAADAGYGYAGPGNRFWPAAQAAGLVTAPRDPWRALRHDGLGMTDLVKRATPRAAELTTDEYRAGAERVRRLVEWLAPRAVCFVGLDGYRRAVHRRARAGWQETPFAGAPTYVMPSTSGLCRSTLDELTAHLRQVAAATA